MSVRPSDLAARQEDLLNRQYRRAIGWQGKTLKEMRREVDRITRETGYYAGLKDLPFKESDPIRYEKIFAKLRGGVVHARETAKRVAASPIVEQEGELCFTLYTPEGDSVVTSTGIIIHVGTMFFMGNGYISSDCGLMGGYPAAAGYRFEAHGTDLKERFEKRLPFPQGGDPDPDDPQYEKRMRAEVVKRDKQAITTEAIFENYDLYLNYLRGGPGFGDPLERRPEAVEADLNGGYLLPRYAEQVYGAVFTRDERGQYRVDPAKTEERRRRMRQERLKRGKPTRQWMEEERLKIVSKDAAVQVRHMYATSFALSESFLNQFRTFWGLPEDWTLREDELEMPTFGSTLKLN